MKIPVFLFFITIFTAFFDKSLESSIFINDFFNKPCNSSFIYSLAINNDYYVENHRFLLCSNFTIESEDISSRISFKIAFASFELTNSAILMIKNCDISFKFNDSQSDIFILSDFSSIFFEKIVMNFGFFNKNLSVLKAKGFFSIVFNDVSVNFLMNSSVFLTFFEISEGNLLEIDGFSYQNPFKSTNEIAGIRDVFIINIANFMINESFITKGLSISGKLKHFTMENGIFQKNKIEDFLMKFLNFSIENTIITIKNISFLQNTYENINKNTSFITIYNINTIYFIALFVEKNQEFSIKIEKFIEITINSSFFLSNTAFFGDSLLFFTNNEEISVFITIFNCSFSDNMAMNSQNSVVLSLFYQGITIITFSVFSNNSILSENPLNNIGTSCIFSPFTAFPRFLHINSSIFKENTAFSAASCVFFEGSHFSLENSLFLSNSMLKISQFTLEKLIYRKDLSGSNILLNVLSVIFLNSEVRNPWAFSGSAINFLLDFLIKKTDKNADFLEFGEFLFKNFSIFNAISLDDGAAILINIAEFKEHVSFSFKNCTFLRNLALKDGGVFKFFGFFSEKSSFLVENSIFDSNIAKRGGILKNDFRFSRNSIVFFLTIFSQNSAFSEEEGGGVFYNAIYIDFLLKNCSFYSNFATNRASLIYMNYGKYRDFGCNYLNNSAGNEAGMVFMVEDCEFLMNFSIISASFSAKSSGFGVIFKKSSLFLSHCKLTDFSSQKTAFLYIGQETIVSIVDSSMGNFTVFHKKAFILMSLATNNSIFIRNCHISHWKTQENSHFYLKNTEILIENTILENSIGSFVNARNSLISFVNFSVFHFICDEKNSEFCLMNYKNSRINITNFSISSVILNEKQSLIKVLFSSFLMILAEISLIYPRNSTLFPMNSLFFFKQSTYQVFSSVISAINLMLFRIILSSGSFLGIFADNSQISPLFGQFISCFLCFSLEIGFSSVIGMKSAIGPVVRIHDIYESFFYQTLSISSFFDKNLTFYIHNSNFSNNSAEKLGGVLYILDFSISINNCSFIGNSASQGGVFFLNCSDFFNKNKCNWLIKNSRFLANWADKRAGVLHWLNRAPVFEASNFLHENSAEKSPIFSSNPIKIILHNENSTIISLKSTIIFDLLDAYNQVYSDENSLAYLIFDKSVKNSTKLLQKFLGNQFVSIKNGSFFFENFNIISEPGVSVKLLVYTDSIRFVSNYLDLSVNSSHKNISNQYYYSITVNMPKCTIGEIYLAEKNLCFQCPDGSFSFNPFDLQCSECPVNAICLKNQAFQTKKGFWRLHANSSKLYRCNIKKAGCLGGKYEDQCLFGYIGPLCSGCLFNSTDKFFNSFGGCSKCGSSNTFLIFISVVILLVGMFALIFFSIKDSQTFVERKDLKEVLVTVLINILINYSQLFSIISNIDIKWPDFFSSSSSSSSSPTSITDFIGIIECPIAEFAFSHKFSIFYVQMVMMAFLFMGMLIGNLVFWLVFQFIRKKFYKKPTDLKNNIILTYIAIYVLMLQPLMNFFTKGFSCIEVGDEFSTMHFLKVAPSIECWKDTHISLIRNVIMPFLMIFIIPPPLFMVYYIAKHKKSEEKKVVQRLFMVTIGYKQKYCYWEFVILLKKIILMYLTIFIRDEPVICVLTLLFVLLVFCNMHVIYNPYEYDFLNRLIFEQYAALFVCYSVFLYFSYTESMSASMFLIIILFFVNFVFFTHWLILFIRYFKLSLKNLTKALSNIRQISSALRRIENMRKRNAVIRSQNSLSKFGLKSSREMEKKAKTTEGKSQEEYEVGNNPFRSERNEENKKEFGEKCEKFNDEKFNDEKFNDEKFSDEKFNDEKFNDEKFNDEKFNDEKFNDEKFNDEKIGENLSEKLIEKMNEKLKEKLSEKLNENSERESFEEKFDGMLIMNEEGKD